MSETNEFYLDSSPSAVMLECVEVKHSLWPESLRFVRNHGDGVTVKHEDGLEYFYQFVPLQLDRGATTNDLDQTIKITVGDLGEVVPQLLKIIEDAESDEKPEVIYRSFSSENLDSPLWVIDGLFVDEDVGDDQATTFDASTPSANMNETGMRYTVEEFPGLRGFFL